MKIYKLDNKIIIENSKHNLDEMDLTTKEIKTMLYNKEIYEYLVESLSIFYNKNEKLNFIINGTELNYYKDDFINRIKNMSLINLSPIKKRIFLNDISPTNMKKQQSKYLSKKYGSLTGYELLEIYISNNPLELCKNKNISFTSFLSYLNDNNFLDKINVLNIPEVENDPYQTYRKRFYKVMNSEFIKIFELYSPNIEEFEENLKKIGLSFNDISNYNPKNIFFEEYNWINDNLVGFKDFFASLEKIHNDYYKGIFLEPNQNEQEFLHKYEIAPEIDEKFLKELQSLEEYNLSDLQKAYYLYRRICQKFSYDEEVFAIHEGHNDKPHGDFSRASEFDFKNNLVICYDIAFIYAKLCIKAGLKAELRDKHQVQWIYYQNFIHDHPHVILWINDYLISADPSAGKINNDMSYEKNGIKVTEFKCINNSDRVKSNFSKELSLVDQIISSKEKDYEYYDLNDILKKHIHINEISNEELEQTFIDILREINKEPGTMMAKMRAFLNLKQRFPVNFRKNITISAVTDFNPIIKDSKVNLSFIVKIKTQNSTNYYLIKNKSDIFKIEEEKLFDLVEKGELVYIDKEKEENISARENRIVK